MKNLCKLKSGLLKFYDQFYYCFYN